METIFLTIHVFIALTLIILVLVQKSSSDGFGMGSGGGGMNLLSGRGAANLLTRSTAIMATLFMANSLFLSVLASNRDDNGSILDKIDAVNVGESKAGKVNSIDDAAKDAFDAAIPEVPVNGDVKIGDKIEKAKDMVEGAVDKVNGVIPEVPVDSALENVIPEVPKAQ